jgi:S1-C subfamily serine protease
MRTRVVNTGCEVIVFDYQQKEQSSHKAKVVEEDSFYDLAILSFRTSQILNKATLANSDMLNDVRVFDEVFAIGFPFAQGPLPSAGVISQIITGNNDGKIWVIYHNTAQLAPGSSGGGLFKKYEGHYYLIGIPFSVQQTKGGQIIPHLSRAISISTAMDFINRNTVTVP